MKTKLLYHKQYLDLTFNSFIISFKFFFHPGFTGQDERQLQVGGRAERREPETVERKASHGTTCR